MLEVLDKTGSPASHWLLGLAISLPSALLASRWPRTLWATIPLAGLVAWSGIALYTDPAVGAAVWAEGSYSYATSVLGSRALILLAPLLGLAIGRRLRSHHHGQR